MFLFLYLTVGLVVVDAIKYLSIGISYIHLYRFRLENFLTRCR